MMKKIWTAVYLSVTVALAVLVFVLQETGEALGDVYVTDFVRTIVTIALAVCAIILVAQAMIRAGVKYSLPVDRYIITNGLAPRGVVRLSPDERITGDFLMVMAAKSEARMCGRQRGGRVEIEIKAEPQVDTEAMFALEYLRRNSGKHGIEVK